MLIELILKCFLQYSIIECVFAEHINALLLFFLKTISINTCLFTILNDVIILQEFYNCLVVERVLIKFLQSNSLVQALEQCFLRDYLLLNNSFPCIDIVSEIYLGIVTFRVELLAT